MHLINIHFKQILLTFESKIGNYFSGVFTGLKKKTINIYIKYKLARQINNLSKHIIHLRDDYC